MKRMLIVAFCLFFVIYILMFSRVYSLVQRTAMPTEFAYIFILKFFVLTFFVYEIFFRKQREKWSTVIFGGIATTIIGSICWFDSAFLFEREKLAYLAVWSQRTLYQNIINGIQAPIYGSLNIFAGIVSALLTRSVLNFERLKIWDKKLNIKKI